MEVEFETQPKKRSYSTAFNSQTQTQTLPNSNNSQGEKPKVMSKDGCDHDADRRFLAQLVNYLKTHSKYTDISDAKIIVEKELTKSDGSKVQARLAFTKSQIRTPFLTHSLDLALQWKDEDNQNVKIDVNTIVVGSNNNKEYNLALSRWNYNKMNSNQTNNKEKKHNKRGWRYVLKNEWNDLKKENNLQQGDVVRLVSFSSHNKLHIAVLKYEYLIIFGKRIEVGYVVPS